MPRNIFLRGEDSVDDHTNTSGHSVSSPLDREAADVPPRCSKFQEFSDDGKIISEPKIDDDIQALEKIGKIADFVDRRIAHLDKRGLEEQVTYNDLEESINILNKMTCKYIRLITNAVAEYSSLRGNNSMGLGKNIFRSF